MPTATNLQAVPCTICKTRGGYAPPDQARPIRRGGDRFGLVGARLCRACYDRQRTLAGAAWRAAESGPTDPMERLALVREAKAEKDAAGLEPILTDAELDALGLGPADCVRERRRAAAGSGWRSQDHWSLRGRVAEGEPTVTVYKAPRFERKAIG